MSGLQNCYMLMSAFRFVPMSRTPENCGSDGAKNSGLKPFNVSTLLSHRHELGLVGFTNDRFT